MGATATNSSSYHYWDYMDGDAMVCSPFGSPKFQNMCNFNQYVLGVVFVIQGLSFLYNAARLGRLASTVLPVGDNFKKERTQKRQHAGNRAHMLYFKKLTYALGFEFVGVGVAHLISGNGTVYSTSAFAGLLSDLVFSVAMACYLYHSLLQLRGAETFKKLVQLPTHMQNVSKKRVINGDFVLDIAQGPGAFPIMFGFWILLACGTMTRSEFFSAMHICMGGAGIRSMYKNILQRVRTLVRLNTLQQNAQGGIEAKLRRRNTLRKKARALVFHMLTIGTVQVMLPLSLVIFRSVKSSTQILIHWGSNQAIGAIFMAVVCTSTHIHVNKSCVKQAQLMVAQTKLHMTSELESNFGRSIPEPKEYTIADESGLSVIGESEIAAERKQNGRWSVRGGLFSDVESDMVCI